ncbi:MAG: TetR/AcrR family transcriptional regulator [Rubrobacter sp.]|nr:TetR/AcrR family transcriptional regulator [Rubrobacter sp.]
MGIKERKQRQRQELKSGILAAAREIASEEGWKAVTIRKIAALIEYSPPVIYEYFDSKDEILLDLMRTGYAEQLEAIESTVRAAKDPEEALLGIGRAWMDFAFRSPDLYQVMYGLGSVPFSAAETSKEGEKIADSVGGVVEGILRNSGGKTDDVGGKVVLLWATVHGLAALAMVGRIPGGQQEARRLAEQAASDLLAAWKGG